MSEPVDGQVGQEGEEVVGLEEVQEGGSSPSRPDQMTLKPLTINTDLMIPPATTEGRRYVPLAAACCKSMESLQK